MRYALLFLLSFVPVLAQDIKFPAEFERLAEKAKEAVDVTLDGKMLEFAGKFLSDKDADQARAKRIVTGLKGVYVRAFEFEKEGEYSPADLESIRSQLKVSNWARLLGVAEKKKGEMAEVYARMENNQIAGLVVLAAEPKELVIVNISGTINLEDLSALGGQFGIPKLDLPLGVNATRKGK